MDVLQRLPSDADDLLRIRAEEPPLRARWPRAYKRALECDPVSALVE